MTNKPHDALFKAAFEHPERAAGLLRSILPATLRDAIAWSTLSLEDGSFVDDELSDRHSDRLFSVELAGGQALIYVLLEHQSTNDPNMPLRMLACMVRIWERFRKQEDGCLPSIIPVLLSHAKGGWTAPRSFGELFDPRDVEHPELARHLPDFCLQVEDLVHRSDAELLGLGLPPVPKVALWLLRDSRDFARLLQSLAEWVHVLNEAVRAPDGDALRSYLSLMFDEFSWAQFRAKLIELAPEAEETIMTMAELWLEQGRAEGRVRGLAEGRAEGRAEGQVKGQIAVLTKLLGLKFGELPVQLRARMETASLAELDTWAERVLRATTLDEVFAE